MNLENLRIGNGWVFVAVLRIFLVLVFVLLFLISLLIQ